jgi:aspartate racemase
VEKKTIGIVGGMGPLATVDLFRKIVVHTKAACDQDHLRILIENDPGIEDRTAALLWGGADPTPKLAAAARNLQRGGAELLVIPCNTAHCFFDAVQAAVDIPVLHMIRVTARALEARGVRKAGLLSTSGTVQTGIYQDVFSGPGIGLLTPGEEGQKDLMDAIYWIKAGKMDFDDTGVRRAADELMRQGAETLILGCTELPLMERIYDYPVTDPTLELALEAVRQAGGEVI